VSKLDGEAEATKSASELAHRMGDGWKPTAWENGGWHYRVCKGKATIYGSSGGRYSAWIEPDALMNNCAAQFIAHGDTPEDALGFAIQDALTFIGRVQTALSAIRG